MPSKKVEIVGLGQLNIYKRRNAKSIRITILPSGGTRVTMPSWLPYKAGVEYAKSKSDWIKQHQIVKLKLLNGRRIGKYHRLVFLPSTSPRISVKITSTEVRINCPPGTNSQSPSVQIKAQQACEKALRQEATTLLPQRLDQLASKYDYSYSSVSIKKLKSRWGSCNHHKQISLNFFLMQLPWPLIDYVLLHELNHTEYLNHSPSFWSQMEKHIPNVKMLRRELKVFQPAL
jgi:predicted metal-dependent hydrolase